jgi:ribonuclease P protein component
LNNGARGLSRFSKREVDLIFKTINFRYSSRNLLFLRAPRLYNYGRILVIASKKVGTAPQRNRIKRQLKALFYENKFFLLPFDIVVLVRPYACLLTFIQLQHALTQALKKPTPENKGLSHDTQNSS